MDELGRIATYFLDCLGRSRMQTRPFRHWLLDRVLPDGTCAAIDALPCAPPAIVNTRGRRETNNSTRLFFGCKERTAHPVCANVTASLQSKHVATALEKLCGIVLGGSFLRVEYCLDTNGFWLEPHTDIGAKLFTMLIYLSNEPGCEDWGTDLLANPTTLVATTPYRRNCGVVFIPADDSWHGFHRRPIAGVRRSLIVNYVKPEWRSRHELAFPNCPIPT